MRASRLLIGLLGLGAASVAQCVAGVEGSGIGSAQASEFYSRKRVKGMWVTGRFPKAEVDGELRRSGARSKPVIVARKRMVLRKRYVARPRIVAVRPMAVPAAWAAMRAADIALPAPPPVPMPLIAALRDEGPGALPRPTAEGEHQERLRRALEAKAQELAGRKDAFSAADITPQPVSMTYDYGTQVRTTVFQNGLVVRETLSGPPGPPVASRLVGTDKSIAAGENAVAVP